MKVIYRVVCFERAGCYSTKFVSVFPWLIRVASRAFDYIPSRIFSIIQVIIVLRKRYVRLDFYVRLKKSDIEYIFRNFRTEYQEIKSNLLDFGAITNIALNQKSWYCWPSLQPSKLHQTFTHCLTSGHNISR